jgi:uncharacterized phage-associated protein
MSTWKLQKLVYYSQAWHLVWEDRALFNEKIEAWANGPVTPTLYDLHRGMYSVTTVKGNADALAEGERESVNVVLHHYADKSPDYLSQLTHLEKPWQLARVGVADGERSNNEITRETMAEYYSSI